jgi:hypothetical protein
MSHANGIDDDWSKRDEMRLVSEEYEGMRGSTGIVAERSYAIRATLKERGSTGENAMCRARLGLD